MSPAVSAQFSSDHDTQQGLICSKLEACCWKDTYCCMRIVYSSNSNLFSFFLFPSFVHIFLSSFKIRHGFCMLQHIQNVWYNAFFYFPVSLLPGKPFCGKQVKWNILSHVVRGQSVMFVLLTPIYTYIPYINLCLNICMSKYIYLCIHTCIFTHVCYLMCLQIM